MKTYKLYLFDFDGTLFDTALCLYYVFKEAYETVGISITMDDVIYLSRVPLLEGYKKFNADEEKLPIFFNKLEECLKDDESIILTRKFNEIDELFSYVSDNNIDIGIVTSNDSKHVEQVLEYLNIDPSLFKVIIGCDKCREIKPSKMPIISALKQLNYNGDYKDVIYVGDSINDCLAAKNAGVDYLLLDRNGTSKSEFKKISNLLELFC